MRAAGLLLIFMMITCTSCASRKSADAASAGSDSAPVRHAGAEAGKPGTRNSADATRPSAGATTASRGREPTGPAAPTGVRRSGLTSSRAIDAALDRPVVEVNFEDRPLAECIAWIAERAHTPIRVDWDALRAAGASPEALVSLREKDGSRRDVLERLLEHHTNGADVSYAVLDGVVLVNTRENIADQPLVRTYDVGDLLSMDRARLGAAGEATAAELDGLAAERLLWVLEAMVEPNAWMAGDPEATAAIFGKLLSVRAPAFTQRGIAGLLGAMRRLQLDGNARAEWAGRPPESIAEDGRLDEVIPEVQIEGAPFEVVLEWVAAPLRLRTVTADWDALGELGVHRDAPVQAVTRNCSVREVLELCLRQITPKAEEAALRCTAGELLVTAISDLEEEPAVRVYDVRGLLDEAAARRAETRSRYAAFSTTQPTTAAVADERSPAPLTLDETGLVRALTFMVLPEWWQPADNGATAECFGGLLFVRGEPGLHERVEQFLRELGALAERR